MEPTTVAVGSHPPGWGGEKQTVIGGGAARAAGSAHPPSTAAHAASPHPKRSSARKDGTGFGIAPCCL